MYSSYSSLLLIRTLIALEFLLHIAMFMFANQLIAFKIQFDNIWHPIYNSQKFFAPETIVIRIQYRTKGSTMGSYNTLFYLYYLLKNLVQRLYITILNHSNGFSTIFMIIMVSPAFLKHSVVVSIRTFFSLPQSLICYNLFCKNLLPLQ